MVIGAGVDGRVVHRPVVVGIGIAEPVDHHEVQDLAFPILPHKLRRVFNGDAVHQGDADFALGFPPPVAHSRRLVRPAP